ncbi:MAG: hypothetical protein AAFR38_01440 [Planctomycetota bacterium]
MSSALPPAAEPAVESGEGRRRNGERRAGLFSVRSVPLMSRVNYALELRSAVFLPFLVAAFEGSAISVLARIAFEGRVDDRLLNALVGVIAVAPPLANLTSFIWVRLSHGADKLRVITRLQAAMCVLALGIALAPLNAYGLVMVVLMVVGGRACWAGVTTLRSTVWKQNYPDGSRARITGRFAMIMVLTVAVLTTTMGWLMEQADWAFRVVIPIGVVLGLVGRHQWSKMRLRGGALMGKKELASDKRTGPSFNPVRMVAVLLDDRKYAAYMLCQFLLGMGNIAAMSVLAVILRERFGLDYFVALLASTGLQYGVMPLAIPVWAKFLDGTHVVRFRAVHSWFFVVALGILAVATEMRSVPLLLAYSLLKGIAFAGGVLGWTLGHLDFAPAEKASQYMGVHVTLTGVRGLLAAAFGVQVYEWLGGAGVDGSGGGATAAVLICLGLTVSGGIGFVLMTRWFPKRGHHEGEGVAVATGGGS